MRSVLDLLAGARRQTSSFLSGGQAVPLEWSLPAAGGPHPAVVLLHGSDGLSASGPRFRQMMGALAGLGYASLLPHYFARTGDDDIGTGAQRAQAIAQSYPLWQEVLADTVAEAARLPGIDPARLGLCGFSLGRFWPWALPPDRCPRRYGA